MITLYLDMDGVFANSDAGIIKLFGKLNVPTRLKYETIDKEPSFWYDLSMCENADKLWELAKPYNPSFLSAIPWKKEGETASRQKQDWVYERFGNVKVHTCLREEKVNYVVDKNTVLVDDRAINIQEWNDAGGTGFIYKPNEFDSFKLEFTKFIQSM